MIFRRSLAGIADVAHGGIECIAERHIGRALAQLESDIGKAFCGGGDVRPAWRILFRVVAANSRLDPRDGGDKRIGVGVAIAAGEFSQKPTAALGRRDRRIDGIILRFLRRPGIDPGQRQ